MTIAGGNQPTHLESLKTRAATYFDRPGLSNPVFISPDELAVLDDRSGRPQVSVTNIGDGDVRSLTKFDERVQTLLGSPSGVAVFGVDRGGNERQQLWRVSANEGKPTQIVAKADRIHEPGYLSQDGEYLLYRSNAREEATFDVLGLNIQTRTEDIWLQGAGQAMPVDLTRDRSQALIIRLLSNMDAELLLVGSDGDSRTDLPPHDGECWILDAAFHPDDRSIWVLNNEGSEFVHLDRIDLETMERTTIVQESWDVEAVAISPDGEWLAWSVNENGWSRVFLRPITEEDAAISLDLPRGTIDRLVWSPDSGHLAMGMSTATTPSKIFVADHNGHVQVLELPTTGPEPFVAEPELVRFPTFDGRDIPAFLFRPDGDGPFPVLMEVHGGPESQRRLQYASAVPTDQLITSLGIMVMSLNVRGSTGYGKTYTHLDDKELRLDAVRDAAAAVEWLHSRADVIPDRIAVMGQSYGGFMTLAAICFHPDLWTAAVDVVGIGNFVTFLERTGPWRREHRAHEYGSLERDRALLERISPLNHVDSIRTPLFVIHGRNDPRVPLHEAEQIVAALTDRDRDVELRIFDNEGHGLAKRENRITGYAEAAAFLVKHLLPQAS